MSTVAVMSVLEIPETNAIGAAVPRTPQAAHHDRADAGDLFGVGA